MQLHATSSEEKNIEFNVHYRNIYNEDQNKKTIENGGGLVSFQNEFFSPIIYSDEQRIKQVMMNLLTNAFKFTRYGSINIFVSIKS